MHAFARLYISDVEKHIKSKKAHDFFLRSKFCCYIKKLHRNSNGLGLIFLLITATRLENYFTQWKGIMTISELFCVTLERWNDTIWSDISLRTRGNFSVSCTYDDIIPFAPHWTIIGKIRLVRHIFDLPHYINNISIFQFIIHSGSGIWEIW